MSDELKPSKRQLKAAVYYRCEQPNTAATVQYEFRLYTAGICDATLSVPATELAAQLSTLRRQGYMVDRLQL